MVGFLVDFWTAPVLAASPLLCVATVTVELLLSGLRFDERERLAAHGDDSVDDPRQVPALRSWPRPRSER
ncbi:MAG: hypothetical protein ACI9EF_002086 [Pseudohongiellaceae bacterium]|jgi:hypothetical protein